MKRRDVRKEPSWPDDFAMDSSATLGEPAAHFLRVTTGPSLFSEFGVFSSAAPPSTAPSASPVFGYSQRNFHISDGNLYSVLSPFQARKSGGRPSFLRAARSCVGDSNDPPTSVPVTVSNVTGCSSTSATSTPRPDAGATRRCKLKFHNQEMPPPYGERSRRQIRSSSKTSTSSSRRVETDSAWFESSFTDDPFCTIRSDDDDSSQSLLSKRLKTPRREQRKTTTLIGGDDEDDGGGSSSRHRLFRDSDWDSEELSLGSKRSYHRRHIRSEHSRSEDWTTLDVDDDDDDVVDSGRPLNLCLADHQRKVTAGSVASSRLQDFERMSESRFSAAGADEADSDVDGFPFDGFSRQRKLAFSSFFNDDFPVRSKFPPEDGFRDDSGVFFRRSRVFEDEPRVLDLSMKGRDSKPSVPPFHESCGGGDGGGGSSGGRGVHPSPAHVAPATATFDTTDPVYVQNCPAPVEAPVKHDRFQPISEMLENMRLQDDDFRQNALKRYQAARERLMQTHPEMFGGWDVGRVEVVQNVKPFPHAQPAEPCVKDVLECPKVASRPRSWDVNPVPTVRGTGPVPVGAESRPDSAPDPSYGTDIGGGRFPPQPPGVFPVAALATPTPSSVLPGATVRSPSVPELSSGSVCRSGGQRGEGAADLPYIPVVLRPCSSCSEVPSMGRASKQKIPESKIKVEGVSAPRPKARSRKDIADLKSSQHANDISICKFKLIKGVHPVLEEKKSFFVPMPRPPSASNRGQDDGAVAVAAASAPRTPAATFATSPSAFAAPSSAATSATDKFRTYKIHLGSQEEMGLKLAAGKRLRRRSRKTLAREKLEATFREQGFLIKTQQVSSAEGAVYCKFRQLKKFTRYLYKSWKDHLPKELDDLGRTSPGLNPPPPPAPPPPQTAPRSS